MIRQKIEAGWTHAQIAEWWSEESGESVARSTISAMVSRYGMSEPLKKYPEEIPWQVLTEHQSEYAVRMLRLLGRRRAGVGNAEANDKRLDAWLDRMREDGTVVVYLPDSPDGFFYIPGAWDAEDLPVKQNYPPAS